MEETSPHEPRHKSSAAKWRGLIIFSAVTMAISGCLLYKAIMLRFNPVALPSPETPLAAVPAVENSYRSIISSAAASAPQEQQASSATGRQEETTAQAVPSSEEGDSATEQTPTEQAAVSRNTPAATANTDAQPAKQKTKKVRFTYYSRETGPVLISGSFLGWKTAEMKKFKGKWVADLYMGPGTYRYYFIVNGVKKPDPSQPLRQGQQSLAVVR